MKLAAGNPGKGPINHQEPQGEPISIHPPEWLSDYAKESWNELVAALHPMGILYRSDYFGLMELAMALGLMREAYENVKRDGNTVPTAEGEKLNPEVNALNQAMRNVKSLISEYGMTPAARTKVIGNAKGERKTPFQKFLDRGKTK